MSKCKGCEAPIIWIRMSSGTYMPCDPEQVTYWANRHGAAKVVTPNGEVISADLAGDPQQATGIGYITHYATCRKAEQFRKWVNFQ